MKDVLNLIEFFTVVSGYIALMMMIFVYVSYDHEKPLNKQKDCTNGMIFLFLVALISCLSLLLCF